MGRIAAPYGVKGWLKVQPFTETIDGLLDYPQWQVGNDVQGTQWRTVQVEEGRIHNRVLLVHLAGLEDRTAAEAMTGLDVAVAKNELPAPGLDEFYWDQLTGMRVSNPRGTVIGRVSGLIESGAHDILRVAGEDGKERLIPFVAAIVKDVDVPAGCITAEWELDY